MATSKSFFGMRRGSTKNFTFSTLDGKQVTKERVLDVKNPRTQNQMAQRMLMTTAGAAYKYLKVIADHSFEGKTVGLQSMSEFMRLNLNKLRAAYKAGEKHAYNAYKDAEINPYTYIVAQGTLKPLPYAFNQSNLLLSVPADEASTAEQIYSALGVQRNDLITFVAVKGHSNIVDGVYSYTPESLKVVRLYCNATGAVTKPLDAFTIESNTNGLSVNVNFTSNTLSIEMSDVDFGTIILSRQDNGIWKRSNASMVGNNALIANVVVANQLASYPIEKELILNNGEMEAKGNEAAGSSLIPQTLSVSPTSVSISTDKGTASVPTLTGKQGTGAVTYSDYSSSIITISGNTITAVGNGSTSVTINVAADDNYAAASIKFNVVVSGQTSSGDTGDGVVSE